MLSGLHMYTNFNYMLIKANSLKKYLRLFQINSDTEYINNKFHTRQITELN